MDSVLRRVSKLCRFGSIRRTVVPVPLAFLIVHPLHHSALGRLQQFGNRAEFTAAHIRDPKRGGHVDAQHMARGRQAQLPEAGHEHVPGLVFLRRLQGMFVVGAAFAAKRRGRPETRQGNIKSSYSALRAGRAFFPAPLAVSGPSAGPEMPAAEGPDAFLPRSGTPALASTPERTARRRDRVPSRRRRSRA